MTDHSLHLPAGLGLPLPRLCLAVTGHREVNPAFAANRVAIVAALARIFDAADAVTAAHEGGAATSRLFTLLAHGADLMAVDEAFERGWEITAPLPFGLALNIAINADPATAEEARALRLGEPVADPALAARAAHIHAVAARASLFELAEADAGVAAVFEAMLAAPGDGAATQTYINLASARAAAAGRAMIEQADVVVGIWDGVAPGGIGGTRHTIAEALDMGTPVIWLDAANPGRIALLRLPEDLFALGEAPRLDPPGALETAFRDALAPPEADQNERAIRFHTEQWHARSKRRFHAYRRIEALFGGTTWRERLAPLRQRYVAPQEVAATTAAPMLAADDALPGGDLAFTRRMAREVLERFGWADGLSTYLSDAYRGGMTMNFVLSALAIVAGVAFLPMTGIVDAKWPFALSEFLLLVSIVAVTAVGARRRWHGRWFETRRVAEYFRHAPIMLLLGVARPTGRWPRGADTGWPEFYAREVLRDLGLPAVKVDRAYLRAVLETLLLRHAANQRGYHEAKAQRLTRVHHGLDAVSEALFKLAVLSVASFLALLAGGALGLWPAHWAHDLSKLFTFAGVSLPAIGGALAGIRYFGDFERFAAISEITAEKLAEIEARIATLLAAPPEALHYAQVAALAHGIDDIVVSEIENWQAVFGSKQIAVPG